MSQSDAANDIDTGTNPPPTAPCPPQNTWICLACTFLNNDSSTYVCELCGTKRPAPAPGD